MPSRLRGRGDKCFEQRESVLAAAGGRQDDWPAPRFKGERRRRVFRRLLSLFVVEHVTAKSSPLGNGFGKIVFATRIENIAVAVNQHPVVIMFDLVVQIMGVPLFEHRGALIEDVAQAQSSAATA